MRKLGVVLAVTLVVGAALFTFAGSAFAQGGPGGRSGGMWGGNTGPMGRGGMMGGGMWGGNYGSQAEMPGFGRGGMMGGFGIDEIATALGLEQADLVTALQDGKTVAEIADEQGVDLQTVADAITASYAERLAAEVEAGNLVQEQADLWLSQMSENVLANLNEAAPMFGGFGGGMWGGRFGSDFEMPGFGFGGHMMGGFGPGAGPDVIATALGLEQADLLAALQDGKTVADIAAEQGVELKVVIDAMTAAHEEQIAAAVEAGRVTQEDADAWLAQMSDLMTEHLNETMPMFGGAAGGFGPGMMGNGGFAGHMGHMGHMGGGRW